MTWYMKTLATEISRSLISNFTSEFYYARTGLKFNEAEDRKYYVAKMEELNYKTKKWGVE